MTAEAAARPAPLLSRVYGRGSVFGKTLRDSRRAALIVTGFCSLLLLVSGSFVASQWGTEATRTEGVALTTALPPIITGFLGGAAINAETLGGFTSWRFGVIFFLAPGIWSLLALSATLVTESRRGSMDFLAGAVSRRRIAIEKLLGHFAAMTFAMLVVALVAWLTGIVFATLPGDEIPISAALANAALMGLLGLTAGSLAFALAQFIDRGGAAGVAAVLLFGGWIVHGYREALPALEWLAPLSWFVWTGSHRPLAGVYDWASLLSLAFIVVAATVIGVAAFERRDLGQVGSMRLPGMPRAALGISGPLLRSLSERLTAALAWGAGIGVYALIIAGSAPDIERVLLEMPTLAEFIRVAFPNVDLSGPGFALQLVFMQIGTLFTGFAAATILAGWASDESDGRLEMVLSTPVSRARWLVETGLGAYLAIGVTGLVAALAAAIGVALIGENPATVMVGGLVLVLYGTAMAGIGVAVGGALRVSAAAITVVVVVVASLLIDIIAPLLELPAWVSDLVLASHYGEPLVGNWDPVGIAVSVVLALGGLAIGAWGFSRRDLQS
jgi:ABC-2 type transport system permease protein